MAIARIVNTTQREINARGARLDLSEMPGYDFPLLSPCFDHYFEQNTLFSPFFTPTRIVMHYCYELEILDNNQSYGMKFYLDNVIKLMYPDAELLMIVNRHRLVLLVNVTIILPEDATLSEDVSYVL